MHGEEGGETEIADHEGFCAKVDVLPYTMGSCGNFKHGGSQDNESVSE